MMSFKTPEEHREYHKEYRAAHPEYRRDKKEKERERKKEYVRKLKEVPCSDCGHEYAHYQMEFDHVHGEKKFTIGRRVGHISWQALHEEIAKCEVVCANCHATRTWQRAAH